MKNALLIGLLTPLLLTSTAFAQPIQITNAQLAQLPFGDRPPPPLAGFPPGPPGARFLPGMGCPGFGPPGPGLFGGAAMGSGFNLPPPLPPPMPPLPPGVELSDEQVEKMVSLKVAFADKNEASMIKIHALEFEFRKALLEPAIDVSRLAQLRGQINRLKEAVDATVNENLIAEAQIFTAEQRKKMRMDLLRHELGPAGFKLPEHQGESAKP